MDLFIPKREDPKPIKRRIPETVEQAMKNAADLEAFFKRISIPKYKEKNNGKPQ